MVGLAVVVGFLVVVLVVVAGLAVVAIGSPSAGSDVVDGGRAHSG